MLQQVQNLSGPRQIRDNSFNMRPCFAYVRSYLHWQGTCQSNGK